MKEPGLPGGGLASSPPARWSGAGLCSWGPRGGGRQRGGAPRQGPRQRSRGSAGAASAGPEDWRLFEPVTLTSRVGPARRLERASWRPTADGPALPGVREPGPGRQVGPPAARRVGRKGPGGEKEWRIWGSRAGGLSNGRKLDQLSPGNAECRALGTSGSSLEDQRLTAPQKRQWVTLLDTRECVPRRGLRDTTFCLRLVSARDHGHKVFPVCVLTGNGQFSGAYAYGRLLCQNPSSWAMSPLSGYLAQASNLLGDLASLTPN